MDKYDTRACNFYYGKKSIEKIKSNKALPLNNNKLISFDTIEIITRKYTKKINIKDINFQNKKLKEKIKSDLKLITKKKFLKKINLSNLPILMGVINLTPDSFSDGGKYNKNNKGVNRAKYLIKKGCKILDVGGEATNPGSNEVEKKKEWQRINKTLDNTWCPRLLASTWSVASGLCSSVNTSKSSTIMLKGFYSYNRAILVVSVGNRRPPGLFQF